MSTSISERLRRGYSQEDRVGEALGAGKGASFGPANLGRCQVLGASKEFYEAVTMITDCHHETADADALRPGPAGECPQSVTFEVPLSRLSTLVGSQIQQIAIR